MLTLTQSEEPNDVRMVIDLAKNLELKVWLCNLSKQGYPMCTLSYYQPVVPHFQTSHPHFLNEEACMRSFYQVFWLSL